MFRSPKGCFPPSERMPFRNAMATPKARDECFPVAVGLFLHGHGCAYSFGSGLSGFAVPIRGASILSRGRSGGRLRCHPRQVPPAGREMSEATPPAVKDKSVKVIIFSIFCLTVIWKIIPNFAIIILCLPPSLSLGGETEAKGWTET